VYLPGDRVVEVSGKGWRWNAGWEGTPVLNVVPDPAGRGSSAASSLIDEIVREGARRMLAEALQAEVGAYIAGLAGERDENGRRLVVRNGYHEPREVLTSAGAVEVTVPRVNDKRADAQTGERMRFSSAILPPWARKTPKVTEVLPLLYLHGLSSGDFVPALGQFPGSAAGLSGPVITKLTEVWKAGQLPPCRQRDPDQRAYAQEGRTLSLRAAHAAGPLLPYFVSNRLRTPSPLAGGQ
jgi:hypothetical protein